jgi:hypothetical protein
MGGFKLLLIYKNYYILIDIYRLIVTVSYLYTLKEAYFVPFSLNTLMLIL